MSKEQKIKLYKDTLEQIVISGHAIKSVDMIGDMFTQIIELARSTLEIAGDIEV